jgi:hypothetical protein
MELGPSCQRQADAAARTRRIFCLEFLTAVPSNTITREEHQAQLLKPIDHFLPHFREGCNLNSVEFQSDFADSPSATSTLKSTSSGLPTQ